MRLPRFRYLCPETVEEALEMLNNYGPQCRILAGGTDLLVRMKQRLATPDYLLSLKHLDGLDRIEITPDTIRIGSRTPLKTILSSEPIQTDFPVLHTAVASVGAPTIQHYRGTLGGNICQDSRCLFYNQSAFFRSGKPACHKAGGQRCYARPDSDRCHATFQSDGATALMALGAKVIVQNVHGTREMDLGDLYTGTGEIPLSLAPNELVTAIEIPRPGPGNGNAYKRLAYRSAIDYPIVNAAVSLQVLNGVFSDVTLVVGSVSRAPLVLAQPARFLVGKPVSDSQAISKASETAMNLASAFVVHNVGATLDYRIQMIAVLVRQAIEDAVTKAQTNRQEQ